MAVQQGIPLNDATLSQMTEEERAFWMGFLQEASDTIDAAGDERPLLPPQSLKEKFETALSLYDGEKYCQMRQLRKIFAF